MNAARVGFAAVVSLSMLAAAATAVGQSSDQRALNPQPEPPRQSTGKKAVKLKQTNPAEMRGLNPQPEPPSRPTTRKGTGKAPKVNPTEMRGLNPQPEPPSK